MTKFEWNDSYLLFITEIDNQHKKLLSIANELYETMGYGKDIENETWPVVDESALVLDEIEIPVQVNGKMRGTIKVSAEANQDEILETAKASEEISKHLAGNIVKVIYVPKKILNIIVK